jgi:phytoene synthase
LVVDEVLAMADGYYRSADEGMRFLPARARWAILVASRLYRGIGRRLRTRYQSNPLLGRVVVPWSKKLAIVVGATGMWLRLAIWRPRAPQKRQLRDYLDGLPYAGS